MILLEYTILDTFFLEVQSRISFLQLNIFRKKGIYDEHKFFMYSFFSWHVGSRAYYKNNEPIHECTAER